MRIVDNVNQAVVAAGGKNTQQLVFRQLVVQYGALSFPPLPASNAEEMPNAGVRIVIEGIILKGQSQVLSWLELYDLESLIMRVMDDDSLRYEAWSIREEFRNLATDDLYRAYVDSRPPDLRDPAVPAAEVRRDVENVLRKLHELRLGRSMLDIIRAYTTSLTFGVTLLLILLIAVLPFMHPRIPVLLLVIVGGIFGAGLSMLQRLSQIPSKGDLVARYPAASRRVVWVMTPLLALTQGSLAAIALYFIFRAGLLTGALFPAFGSSDVATATRPDQLLYESLLPVGESAKLLVWSLVAGTAERLVPDLLTRLSDQANKSQLGSQKTA